MQNLDLFVFGFSCKSNSRSNSERYTSDPIDVNKPECQTFVESLAFVKKHRPKFYILENVLGALQPRIKGGKETPLMWYEEALQSELPDYTHAAMVVDALPQPESRARVVLLGSSDSNFIVSDWVREQRGRGLGFWGLGFGESGRRFGVLGLWVWFEGLNCGI